VRPGHGERSPGGPTENEHEGARPCGRTGREVARASGARERTVTVPALAARVTWLRAEIASTALGRLVDSIASAAETLGLLARMAEQEGVRLATARAVLELGINLRESVELEERIASLEADREATRNGSNPVLPGQEVPVPHANSVGPAGGGIPPPARRLRPDRRAAAADDQLRGTGQ
jgi:hypothetical protein